MIVAYDDTADLYIVKTCRIPSFLLIGSKAIHMFSTPLKGELQIYDPITKWRKTGIVPIFKFRSNGSVLERSSSDIYSNSIDSDVWVVLNSHPPHAPAAHSSGRISTEIQRTRRKWAAEVGRVRGFPCWNRWKTASYILRVACSNEFSSTRLAELTCYSGKWLYVLPILPLTPGLWWLHASCSHGSIKSTSNKLMKHESYIPYVCKRES